MGDLSAIIAEFERMYSVLASEAFRTSADPKAPPFTGIWGTNEVLRVQTEVPVITVASRGRKRTVGGWYVPAVWKDGADELLSALAGTTTTIAEPVKRAEIVIASELLSDPAQAVAELARQMAQHARTTLRVGENFYYSQHWSIWSYGLACSAEVNPEQPSKGWSKWVPSAEFRQWVDQNLNTEPFNIDRDQTASVERKGSRMKKWECGCTVIRSVRLVTAVCARCGQAFRWAEPLEPLDGLWARNLDQHFPVPGQRYKVIRQNIPTNGGNP